MSFLDLIMRYYLLTCSDFSNLDLLYLIKVSKYLNIPHATVDPLSQERHQQNYIICFLDSVETNNYCS